ncbi:MAG: tRNA-guanine transglycosylase, partial [Candidatus Zixiibacteriota bacterium]
MNNFEYKIIKKDKHTNARVGVMETPHGEVNTPVFMPVGTQASVKTLSSEDLKDIGAELILGNTYHLYLRPGHQLIEK